MLSIKSFKHDRYFSNNIKHKLTKCKIIKITVDTVKSKINDIAIDNLKQMMINCVIFTYLYKYNNYLFIEYLGINTFHNNYHAFKNYDNGYDNYYCSYYCSNEQLYFQQKLLDNSSNKISMDLNIKNHFKYTQLWIINEYKKLQNNKLITL